MEIKELWREESELKERISQEEDRPPLAQVVEFVKKIASFISSKEREGEEMGDGLKLLTGRLFDRWKEVLRKVYNHDYDGRK